MPAEIWMSCTYEARRHLLEDGQNQQLLQSYLKVPDVRYLCGLLLNPAKGKNESDSTS
jgi:hypothetical protein